MSVVDFFKAEYIWIDGQKPVAKLRSKTKVLPIGVEPPTWSFDGSSTAQAEGGNSDLLLEPVFICPDPLRGEDSILVLCEVMMPDGTPHPSNFRSHLREVSERNEEHETIIGIEQEYTLFEGMGPLGWPKNGFPAPQGGYYCGVGADEVFGRDIVEDHLDACLIAGLMISGVNAEVMPAQWEFQIGPLGPLDVSDQIWVARWLLYRIAEEYGVSATLAPKPVPGDWNGAGAHTNFSTKKMREEWQPIIDACEALGKRTKTHIANYGDEIEKRLTGLHETCSWEEYKWGIGDRGASVRIPRQVGVDRRGYIEDRRPNANIDPYIVTRLMIETIIEGVIDEESEHGALLADR